MPWPRPARGSTATQPWLGWPPASSCRTELTLRDAPSRTPPRAAIHPAASASSTRRVDQAGGRVRQWPRHPSLTPSRQPVRAADMADDTSSPIAATAAGRAGTAVCYRSTSASRRSERRAGCRWRSCRKPQTRDRLLGIVRHRGAETASWTPRVALCRDPARPWRVATREADVVVPSRGAAPGPTARNARRTTSSSARSRRSAPVVLSVTRSSLGTRVASHRLRRGTASRHRSISVLREDGVTWSSTRS